MMRRMKQKMKKMRKPRPYSARNNSGDAGRLLKDKKEGSPRESGWERPAGPDRPTDRPTDPAPGPTMGEPSRGAHRPLASRYLLPSPP
jgi:hypothetical protein